MMILKPYVNLEWSNRYKYILLYNLNTLSTIHKDIKFHKILFDVYTDKYV